MKKEKSRISTKSENIKSDILYDAPKVFKIEEVTTSNEDKAILTHWLHNRGTKFAKPYEKSAKKLLPSAVWKSLTKNDLCVCEDAGQQLLFPELFDVPFPPPENPKFTFIDLFAGIGGIRLGFQSIGGKCIFSSEWDEYAAKTYNTNFGEIPFGDITKPEVKNLIPSNFDIVCAGFPCQAFSLAGKRLGFDDNYKGLSRGTLFREVVEICEKHKPKVVFCENVKGLTIHDKGNTFKIIKGAFAELGYNVFSQILNSKNFGVPQNRERIYIVAFRNDIDSSSFSFPKEINNTTRLCDIKEEMPVPAKYYLSSTYVATLIRHKARHAMKGNGFGYEIRQWDGIAGAIVCGGMGRERNLVVDNRQKKLIPTTHIKGEINKDGIRKMTPREWARLQGFPDVFEMPLADVHLYKQFGNSVTVPVIQAIAKKIEEVLENA